MYMYCGDCVALNVCYDIIVLVITFTYPPCYAMYKETVYTMYMFDLLVMLET